MTIRWNTPAGRLGTLKELDYSEIVLDAVDTDSAPLEFTQISGTLPPGMYVTTDGRIKGVPTITGTTAKNSATYVFSVRANNPAGVVADRTFSIIVTNQSVLTIYPRVLSLGAFDNGKFISYQFQALTDNPNANLTWSVTSGNLPLDIRTGEPITISQTGLLSGYIARLLDNTNGTAGYDNEADDSFPFDFSSGSKDKVYSFQIQVTDGYSYDSVPVTIAIVSKGNYTSDNGVTLINNTTLTVDADDKYVPVITTDPSNIPVLEEGSKFSFKFDAIDPDDDVVYWSANAGLPSSVTISSVTGWLTGTIPVQSEEQHVYSFEVTAYKRDNPVYASVPMQVNITAVRDSSNYITWSSPDTLGTIVNGSVSELKIGAVSNLGKNITFTKLAQPSSKLPQGLKLLSTGEIIGRSTFQYFNLDGDSSRVTVDSTSNITVGMTVEGPGVASGSKVIEVINSHTVKIKPAIFVVEGTEITFRNLLTNFQITTRTTDLNTTTTIDKGKTTFDSSFKFSVRAVTDDNTASAIKEFTIKVNNYNRAPYENIYLTALPAADQRTLFNSIVSNTDIFPDELIYRSTDPWFGKAKDIRMLFVPGLTTSALSVFANAIEKNHYTKKINFGNIKTARAVDSNFNTKYEVVYLEVEDTKQINGVSAALTQEPAISNYYDGIYHTVYANSFANMTYRLAAGVGYNNRGALPDWMTSPQDDGRVLGLTRAVVLAYTVPGASKLIAYRLSNSGINFNNIDFVADRYQLDASLSENYNTSTNQFYQDRETTFDVLPDIDGVDQYIGTVANIVALGSTIILTAPPTVGQGWAVEKSNTAAASIVDDGTFVVSTAGNVITTNQPVSLAPGDQILFRGTASATYAVNQPFDTINHKFVDQVAEIDGVKNYVDGETIVFIKHEQFTGYTGANDGWNYTVDLYSNNETEYDIDSFDNYNVIPGYAEKLLDSTIVNQRAGIWKINISADKFITLTFVKEVLPNQIVKVFSGTSHAGTFMRYNPTIPVGATVPLYTPESALQNSSEDRTSFDGLGTRFYDHRDKYTEPESGDKYIRFPQIGVYR